MLLVIVDASILLNSPLAELKMLATLLIMLHIFTWKWSFHTLYGGMCRTMQKLCLNHTEWEFVLCRTNCLMPGHTFIKGFQNATNGIQKQ